MRSIFKRYPTDPKGRVGGVLCATKWYHSTRGGRQPHTLLVMGTPLTNRTKKLIGNDLSVDDGRGDEGLSGGLLHDLLGVEGSGVSGDGDFLLCDAVHSGEFVGSFNAVVGCYVIVADELEEEGGEVDFKGVRVDGGGFFHLGADIEPIGVGFKAFKGG